jgi:hypothetical protein
VADNASGQISNSKEGSSTMPLPPPWQAPNTSILTQNSPSFVQQIDHVLTTRNRSFWQIRYQARRVHVLVQRFEFKQTTPWLCAGWLWWWWELRWKTRRGAFHLIFSSVGQKTEHKCSWTALSFPALEKMSWNCEKFVSAVAICSFVRIYLQKGRDWCLDLCKHHLNSTLKITQSTLPHPSDLDEWSTTDFLQNGHRTIIIIALLRFKLTKTFWGFPTFFSLFSSFDSYRDRNKKQ